MFPRKSSQTTIHGVSCFSLHHFSATILSSGWYQILHFNNSTYLHCWSVELQALCWASSDGKLSNIQDLLPKTIKNFWPVNWRISSLNCSDTTDERLLMRADSLAGCNSVVMWVPRWSILASCKHDFDVRATWEDRNSIQRYPNLDQTTEVGQVFGWHVNFTWQTMSGCKQEMGHILVLGKLNIQESIRRCNFCPISHIQLTWSQSSTCKSWANRSVVVEIWCLAHDTYQMAE